MAPAALSAPELEAHLESLHEASFGWARNCCHGDADEAADVLQTCYVKVLSGRARFEGRSSVRTWFFGVIRLTALESRRQRTRAQAVDALQDAPESPPETDAPLLDAEDSAALRAALLALPERQREVLHLVFYQGLSVAEAASVMELSVGSARVHYDRGKKRMRLLLAPTFNDDRDVNQEATQS